MVIKIFVRYAGTLYLCLCIFCGSEVTTFEEPINVPDYSHDTLLVSEKYL